MENSRIKVAILTGNELRHRYFAAEISRSLTTVLVAYEKKANVHENIDFGPKGNDLVKTHFAKRAEYEHKYFNNFSTGLFGETMNLSNGAINEPFFVKRLKEIAPDYILLFGSSLIKDEILSAYPNKVINLHLGISPYYRGSGTLFWPLVDGLPECIGSTIHLAVKKIDAGGILAQVRPEIADGDTVHDLGNKTIIASVARIPQLLKDYHEGLREPQTVDMSKGKLCFRADLKPEAIAKLYFNFKNNMIYEFLKNKELRTGNFPIIN